MRIPLFRAPQNYTVFPLVLEAEKWQPRLGDPRPLLLNFIGTTFGKKSSLTQRR